MADIAYNQNVNTVADNVEGLDVTVDTMLIKENVGLAQSGFGTDDTPAELDQERRVHEVGGADAAADHTVACTPVPRRADELG